MKRLFPLIVVPLIIAGCNKTPPSPKQSTNGPHTQADKDRNPPKGDEKESSKNDDRSRPTDKVNVALTPAAGEKIRTLLKDKQAKYLRVSVEELHPDTGEFKRKLDLDDAFDPKEDYLSESQGVRIVVDKRSLLFLQEGTIVDLGEDEQSGFRFIDPIPVDEPPDKTMSLIEARRGFKTNLTRRASARIPVEEPPAELFQIVRYDSSAGKLAAYLTPDRADGKKHSAIIWLFGGFSNSIGGTAWQPGPPSNDQSARAFREAEIVMMFPSLRGGNDNPGVKEGFLGEVDDVLAAAKFLGKQEFVDPQRIYLGGHSTGGTLALLAAECSDRFRAVFSFGPVDNPLNYGAHTAPFALSDRKEVQLRSPGRWLHSIRSPTFVFEGTKQGNLSSLQAMARLSTNPKIQFLPINGANHFNLLAPTTRLIAEKNRQDNGASCNLAFSEEEVSKPFAK